MSFTAILEGTWLRPELRFRFGWGASLNGAPVQNWVKALPGRRWDKEEGCWFITGTGFNPDKVLASRGIVVDFSQAEGELAGLTSLEPLWRPVVKYSRAFPDHAFVYPRMAGFERVSGILGPGGVWDKTKQRFQARVTDLVDADGNPKRGLQGADRAVAPAAALRAKREIPADVGDSAKWLASSTGFDLDDVIEGQDPVMSEEARKHIGVVANHTGKLPDWFGLALYPFQECGAYSAAAGFNLLCDEPGLGKGGTVDSKILTPTGWTTYGEIKVGDKVIGSNGRATAVTGVFPRGELDVFRVTMSDGPSVRVDGDHLWDADAGAGRVVFGTRELAALLADGVHPPSIPMVEPVHFDSMPAGLESLHRDPSARLDALAEFIDHAGSAHFGRIRTGQLGEGDSGYITDAVQSLGGTVETWESGLEITLPTLVERIDAPRRARHAAVPMRRIVSIEPDGRAEVVCISVAAEDRLYVTESFIVTHNTRSALAAAAITGAKRVLVLCPPLVLTNWAREASTALGPGIKQRMDPAAYRAATVPVPTRKPGKRAPKKPDPFGTVIVRPGRKVPDFPEDGVLIVAYSLITARPELLAQVVEWGADAVLVDESHYLRTWTSGRGSVVRRLAATVDGLRLPMTGTPMLSNPSELANQMAISGHLDPIFGGASTYLDRFTSEDPFGGRKPVKRELKNLRNAMDGQVWTRRNKGDVLLSLPGKLRAVRMVDVDNRAFETAHDELYEKLDVWVDEHLEEHGIEPDEEVVRAYARSNVGLLSPLRKAAGMSKVPAAIEIIADWMDQTTSIGQNGQPIYERPLVVWAHHHVVLEELRNSIPEGMAAAVIDGSTSSDRRAELADEFQAGKIGVLICSIIAAGFGITLTRGSDAIFVETDWTPAHISQAEDRCVLEGQMVRTISGDKPIEKIQIGDLVLTHKGNWKAVKDTWSRVARDGKGRKIISEIKYIGHQEPLKVTSDHEILVRRAGTVSWVEASTILPGDEVSTPKANFTDVGIKTIVFPDRCRRWTLEEIKRWSTCSECGSPEVLSRGLCKNHYALMKRDHYREFGQKTPLPNLGERRPNGRYKPMPRMVELDDRFLSLCGLYVAEGFSTVDEAKGAFVSVSGHLAERHFMVEHGEYIKRTFGFNYTIRNAAGTQGIEMRVYSQDLAEWFLEMFSHGARNKSIPEWVFSLSLQQAEQFFYGYMAGDGHAKQSANQEKVILSWTTASPGLDSQLCVIASALGYRTLTRVIHPKATTIGKYEIQAGPQTITEFTDNQHDGESVWRKVTSSSHRFGGRDERVWDLTVADDESYVVGNVAVHNCNRIGQTSQVITTTLIAPDTLDLQVRAVLRNKAETLNQVVTGADNDVAKADLTVGADGVTWETTAEEEAMAAELPDKHAIIVRIVEDILRDRAKKPVRRKAKVAA